MRKEEWRDLPGWETYYQVSDKGRFRTIARHYKGKRLPIKYFIHKPHWSKDGDGEIYYKINAGKSQTPISYSKLYAAAFKSGPITYKTFSQVFVKKSPKEGTKQKLNRLISSMEGKTINECIKIIKKINILGAKYRFEEKTNQKELSPFKINSK